VKSRNVAMNVLIVNLRFSALIFWIGSRVHVLPRRHELTPRLILLPIRLLHSYGRLGFMFLAPGRLTQREPAPPRAGIGVE
jgi:hypothetical protein